MHDPDQMHLHIVCTDTCERGLNLLVPVSSFYDGCDGTCELDVGDHEFLQHLSFVFYAKAKLVEASRIDHGFNVGRLIQKPDMAADVFGRVEAGLCISPDTPRKIKNYFGCDS